MAGEVASTVLSRMAVPVLYYMAQKPSSSSTGTHVTEIAKEVFV
jgi:hypothetical protein